MTELSTGQKKRILVKHGWDLMRGYCFPTPPADEHSLTFVEEEEAIHQFNEGAKDYHWSPNHECLYDLDEAWEWFLDGYYDDNDLSEKEAIEKLKEEGVDRR